LCELLCFDSARISLTNPRYPNTAPDRIASIVFDLTDRVPGSFNEILAKEPFVVKKVRHCFESRRNQAADVRATLETMSKSLAVPKSITTAGNP